MPEVMKFQVVLEPDEEEGGYTVYCPALPGCISEGDTREESLTNIAEAIRLYLRAVAKETALLTQQGGKERPLLAEVAV